VSLFRRPILEKKDANVETVGAEDCADENVGLLECAMRLEVMLSRGSSVRPEVAS
jgi:hypothetical protein